MSSAAPTPAAAVPATAPPVPAVPATAKTPVAVARAAAPAPARPAAPLPARPALPPRPAPAPAPAQPTAPWERFFTDWPASIPERGVVITQLNESCAFKGFMLRDGFVLFERVSPDSLGGRFMLTPYEEIAAVKFTDPLKQDVLEAAGFKGKLG